MGAKLKQIDFKYFPLALIIVYVPFHLFEEAIGNFPFWMFEHYKLPQALSYPHWLINNSFFFIILLIGLIIYNRNRIKNLAFGIGILLWALMNSIEHILFTIIDIKIAPGLFTAFLFVLISILGLIKLKQEKILNPPLLFKSILIALSYWIAAFVLIMSLGSYLVKVFP